MVDYDEILKFIREDIIPKYPELLSCTMHFLPDDLDKDVEYVFKLNGGLSESQFWRLWADVDLDLHIFYDKLNLNFDFITVLF